METRDLVRGAGASSSPPSATTPRWPWSTRSRSSRRSPRPTRGCWPPRRGTPWPRRPACRSPRASRRGPPRWRGTPRHTARADAAVPSREQKLGPPLSWQTTIPRAEKLRGMRRRSRRGAGMAYRRRCSGEASGDVGDREEKTCLGFGFGLVGGDD